MKAINQTTRNLIDNYTTPRMVIDLPDGYSARIYTTPPTANGHASVIVLYSRDMDACFYRTVNGQCSSTSRCLEELFIHVDKIPKHLKANFKRQLPLDAFSIHHVGGNYYKVKQWVKLS